MIRTPRIILGIMGFLLMVGSLIGFVILILSH